MHYNNGRDQHKGRVADQPLSSLANLCESHISITFTSAWRPDPPPLPTISLHHLALFYSSFPATPYYFFFPFHSFCTAFFTRVTSFTSRCCRPCGYRCCWLPLRLITAAADYSCRWREKLIYIFFDCFFFFFVRVWFSLYFVCDNLMFFSRFAEALLMILEFKIMFIFEFKFKFMIVSVCNFHVSGGLPFSFH